MRYDFVEIGTSDFDTLIEQAGDETVGISVEPLKYYLDRLPDKPLVKKLNVAISSKDSFVDIYYIPEDKIVKHSLPYWVRGSNSVGKPHPFTIKEIGKELYDQIVQVKQVKCISMQTLVADNNVTGIQLLKIDTEGMDHIILRDFLDLCKENKSLLPAQIKFERNPSVSNMSETNHIMERLKNLGYNVEAIGNDVICNMQTLQTLQIPRIIHQTFKTNILPPDLQKAVNGLRNMNPTFEYRFYDDQACVDFIRDNYPEEYLDDYLSINPLYGAARADFFRYLLMYKEGGVYLDIKSATLTSLEETLLPTDEYILTHWEGKDWAEELGYVHGEFQNWHIICRPGHPFLEKVIDLVRNNLKSYKGEIGKPAVLKLTGPVAYSKAILNIFNDFDRFGIGSPIREFATADEIGLIYMATAYHHHTLYPDSSIWTEPIVLRAEPVAAEKHPKAWVLYANEPYIPTLQACVDSLNRVSEFPIIVYLINSDKQIRGAKTINWKCNVPHIVNQKTYIDRKDPAVYRMMIQRPMIVRDALLKYAEFVCYVDADSVATQYADNIFDYYPVSSATPYFVEGIYDYLHVDGRGGADSREDMSTTLEAPACLLFETNQYVRQRYRQTGYFVAGQQTIQFLEEWWLMCTDKIVLQDNAYYAPYNEETLANVLLWRHVAMDGLPSIYCNASLPRLQKILDGQYEYGKYHEEWFKLPNSKEELMFIHGEKKPETMNQMSELLTSMKDTTRSVPGYPNYTVDIYGNVTNIKLNQPVLAYLNQGRWIVELWKNNKKKHWHIHRLLAETFIPNPENKPQINHIDGNPQNNSLDNLEWVTDRENKLHAYANGLIVQAKIPVIQYTKDGDFIAEYESILAANKATKVDRKSIQLCADGDYSQAGGFLWEYAENKEDEVIKNRPLRIMFLPSHLSTGGMPAFLQKRIEALKAHADVEIFVVEYECYSMDFVVQRNAIRKLVGDNFVTLYENKLELFKYINEWKPNVIHIDEMSERMNPAMIARLYANDRSYRIVETCHDISFKPADKRLYPDAYAFCTPYHMDTFSEHRSLKDVIEFPIDIKAHKSATHVQCQRKLGMDTKKTHVLNVGLWTPGKNQGEGLQIAAKYPEMMFHFVGNQAGNFAEYWKPLMKDVPENVKIWGERDDMETFYKAADIFMFNSTWECNPLVLREAISHGLPIVARNLPQYKNMFTDYIQPITTDLRSIKKGYKIPVNNKTADFALKHMELYSNVWNTPVVPQNPLKVTISQHFVEQPFLEITGAGDELYLVKMFDEQNVCQYENSITPNHWIKLNRRWFTRWRTEVWLNKDLVYENTLSYKGKRVFISFESHALGDTLAWIPYALAFQEKHECHVIVSTFKNNMFKKVYPELEFVEPGVVVHNLHGLYRIGYFHDLDKDKVFPSSVPLQQTPCNILGLEYKELLPRIDFTPKKRMYSFKYVTIATNSTAGCKYWQKADWQILVDYLISKGYKVINVSKEKNPLNDVDQIKDDSMENTMHTMYHADFMVGLSSGLSWLNWALGKKTVMIANFTNKDYEFKTNCIRVVNETVCHDCWSTNKFDLGDWNWCPNHKSTARQFECQRSITAEMVIEKMQPFITGEEIPIIDSNISPVSDDDEFDWGWMNTPEGLSNKRFIEREIKNNTYEKYFEVEEGDLVLDIGASVGTFPWSIKDKKPAHIYCLEPSSVEFPTLQKNMKDLPVTCINQGIWYDDGMIRNEQVFGPDKSMPCVTFNTLRKSLNDREIDFMKCDCEGGEYYIFTGEHLFFLLTKVKKIAVEFHLTNSDLKDKFREFRDTILRHIKGYTICDLNGKEITEKLFTEDFISYYSEIMIYIDNR